MYSAEEKIRWFAISSRIAVYILQFVANYAIEDHHPKVFKKPLLDNQNNSLIDVATRGLTHWDAQYFLHIADYGYTYENALAFFPLYPLLVRFLSNIFQIGLNNMFYFAGIPFFLSKHCSLVLMALLLNNVLFVHTALALYKLTLRVIGDEKIAYMAALLFCVNPASIFFSAAYSETLFCFLSFHAMLSIESGHLVTGSFLCGLSGVTRSNGLINVGYIGYRALKSRSSLVSFILTAVVTFLCLTIAILPFLSYQFYCYSKFCVPAKSNLPDFIVNYGRRNKYGLPGVSSSWCEDKIPFAYKFVQSHYWDVGFLKYFEIKQLPNFALAAPILVITFYGIYKFVNVHKFNLLLLGLVPGREHSIPSSCFPYFVHACFLTIFGLFFMHVQVTTRLICSACPAFYWICADICSDMSESKEASLAKKLAKKANCFFEPSANLRSKWKTILLTERFFRKALAVRYYFFAYFLAGCVIFSNNLPWT